MAVFFGFNGIFGYISSIGTILLCLQYISIHIYQNLTGISAVEISEKFQQ